MVLNGPKYLDVYLKLLGDLGSIQKQPGAEAVHWTEVSWWKRSRDEYQRTLLYDYDAGHWIWTCMQTQLGDICVVLDY